MLVDIADRLSRFETFEPWREYWASCLQLLLEAMIQEHHYRQQYNAGGVSTLPTLDEYLRNGMYSVGMHLWQSTALILLRDFSVLNHFDSIHEAVNQASKAIRLYNDLQTFDKEIQEGSVNSVLVMYHVIRDRDPNAAKRRALSEAQTHTLQLADSYARKCHDLVAQIQTESGQFEETIRRLVAFGAFFYREHDYHTTPMTKVNEFLDPSKDQRETTPGRCKDRQVASTDIKEIQQDQQVGGAGT
jgi:hypothetical protein